MTHCGFKHAVLPFFCTPKTKKNGFFISMILVPLILMVSGCIGPKNQGVTNNQIFGKIQKKTSALPAIWVGFVGTSKTDPDVIALRQLLALKKVHGIILFDRNIKNPDQLRSLVSFLTQNNPNIPVAIDQEGGKVARLKAHKGFVACGAMRAAADYRGNVLEI
jgi:hypothetical protein